ncbi:laminin subunit beta-3 isoform X2 [Misgurnus anguillicaudatus]|uniref:laminin subunit beta-3 isoform X2 n=1 Tax=Misgurnus anguillicaudatus TaxID=75329 RepID=UPI003CCF8458
MKTWTLFLTAALSAVCIAQKDCWHGACYPPTGDLLMGREQNLRASSTCGLMGSEVICTPHANTMKCCPCDSRYPAAYNAHTIQNVLSSAGPTRWWQSKKDVNPVSIQLDLNGIYQLETLFLSFKGPRPEALIIERTKDFGRTWQPALYLAADCPSTFPWVDTTLPRTLDGTYCFTLPSTGDNPYRDQKVHYYPLRQFANIDLPSDYKIEVASGFTGLRVNLTQLGRVPSMPGRSLSQFYALREMRVIGSCFCHGHANRCLPDTTNNIKVGGTCDCQHNTAGVNCERCDDFFNDLPWRPAENSNPHTCKRCDCNNHSDRCHFDPLRYEETGRRSGGVCDACMHHTTGPNCERCAPNYYPNPLSDMRSPDACLRCQCNSAGSLNSGQCDTVTGQCLCKAHVEGANCDRCKHGYYNLNANNPSGCSSCQCNFAGSLNSGQCDAVTGQCLCKAHVEGTKCDRCRPGYHNLNANDPSGCSSCQCNSAGSLNFGQCDAGQCLCKPHVEGAKCDRCKPGYYNLNANNPSGCSSCQCNSAGSLNSGQCDAGQCLCKAHVEGAKCDRCKPGYYNLDPNNPSGCSKCLCSTEGSLSSVCDQLTGQCLCRPHVEGLVCDRCSNGYWNLKSPNGCQPCDCDPKNARSTTCDQFTGQCQCRYSFGGRTCSGCPDNTYGNHLIGCRPCDCDPSGTELGGCDKLTGLCRCKPGVTGARCDSCKSGHCDSFPQCPACPSCIFSMNTELQNLTLLLEHLSNNRIPESTSEEVNRKIRRLQITLTKIQESMFVPPSSSDTLIQTLEKLDTLRTQMNGLTKDLSPQPSDPDLKKRLDELEELMSSIRLEYLAKRDAIKNIDTSNNTGAYNAIQNSYDTSTDALKKAEAAQVTLKKLTETRDKAIKDLNRVQPANTKDLLKLKEDLATRPDLTPAAEKVCGSTRVEPCTPQQCTGDVCPPAGTPPCGPEETCIGALPNANKAFQNAEEVKDKLRDLNDKIAKALTQIQEADDSANKVRLSTDKLANQIKQVRDDVDGDLKDAKDFISTLKDYLSAPHSDPDEVQRICENVLEAKLPINVENLKKKLKEMQDLASSLPDSSKVLESTKPELEKARKLLEEAQKTRDAAFGILNDTESIQKSLDEDEPVLDDLEKKIQKSLDIAKNVKENVEKIEDTLAPVEKGIEGITGLVDEMRPLLDTLKKDIQTGTGLADDAQDKAEEAQDEADQAAKDLEALKDEIEKLKVAAEANSEAGEVGDRLKKLQDEASTLVSDTANITTALRDKEAEIKKGTEELLKNADRLSGLEAKLEILREDIRLKVTGLNLCQG